MAFQKCCMFDKRWKDEILPNYFHRHLLIEYYYNIKKWGLKLHVEYDGDTIMNGYEIHFQIMIGPIHFMINWENYYDEDNILEDYEFIEDRRQNAEQKFD